jgi:hypothetical protein
LSNFFENKTGLKRATLYYQYYLIWYYKKWYKV